MQPLHLEGIQVSSGSNKHSSTARNEMVLERACRTELVAIYRFDLFMYMARRLMCSSALSACFLCVMIMRVLGTAVFQHFAIFL